MEYLNRQQVIAKFDELVEKYGNPKRGTIFNKEQLMGKIAYELCKNKEVTIMYGNNSFFVSSNEEHLKAVDYKIIGIVKPDEWFSKEQLKALHEVTFAFEYL